MRSGRTTNVKISKNRRSPVESQIARISCSPPLPAYQVPNQEREPCPLPPPPPRKPPPPKDDRLFWGTLALLVSTGAFAVYAKSDPEVRDWITINAPWFDDMIAVAYQENMSYGEWATFNMQRLKTRILCFIKQPTALPCEPEVRPVVYGPLEKVQNPCGEQEDEMPDVEGNPCARVRAPLPTKDLCDIDECLHEKGARAVAMYTKARDACRAYNKLVEKKMTIFKVPHLDELRHKMEERLQLVNTCIHKAQDAKCQLDDLHRYFVCDIKNGTKEEIELTKQELKDFQTKIKALRIQFEWDNDVALAKDKQLMEVEALVMQYVKQLQILYAGLDFKSEKPMFSGNADMMLHHTKRNVEKLRTVLDEAVVGMTSRVNHGLECLPQDEKSLTERTAKIQKMYSERKAALDAEYKKRSEDQKKHNERDLKEGLKLQGDKSLKTQNLRLDTKERDSNLKLKKIVADAVTNEKKMMANQLQEMNLKLKLVQAKLDERLKAEREARRSQELWTAGASLLAATKKGDPYVNVNKELDAIEKASGGADKLVLSVLKAIPERVRKRGLVPESVLKERFTVMEDTALKVALVEQEGASLPVYFISWLQSLALFMKMSGIPQSEIDKVPKIVNAEESGLDTFDLLQRARFWMERDNIANALIYMNALEGASKGAAAAWQEDAQCHLECRQAAEAVIAHATALGLQYI